MASQSFFKLSVLNMSSARKAEERGVAVATSTDGAKCQWHLFSTDRSGTKTNAADGGIGSADN